ncbi:hypothetical protein EDC26_102349 [Paralcaligenes ureilyticus]|uniref:Uncharacterized protein n=1 Tax=Paralcaligenes ureilyticus TaxID=627131 RepID=A0A4R3MB77_9BURK|nr:hypothetical protein EDC26_102349 [Paralcaligenes ureilyticus]
MRDGTHKVGVVGWHPQGVPLRERQVRFVVAALVAAKINHCAWCEVSLDILRLLSHLLDLQLKVDRGAGDAQAAGFGSQSIGLAVHFLK